MAKGGISAHDEVVSLADYSLHMFGDRYTILFDDRGDISCVVFSEIVCRE